MVLFVLRFFLVLLSILAFLYSTSMVCFHKLLIVIELVKKLLSSQKLATRPHPETFCILQHVSVMYSLIFYCLLGSGP
jgi:hypothetical protein